MSRPFMRMPLAATLLLVSVPVTAPVRAQLAVQSSPAQGDADAYYEKGVKFSQANQLDAVIDAFQNVIRLRPGDSDAHTFLGILYEGKGRHDEAVAELRKAVRLNPSDADAHYNLGLVLDKSQPTDALVEYRTAVKLNPNKTEAHTNLGIALARSNQLDEAIPEFQEAMRQKPDLAQGHSNLGKALLAKGQYREAALQFRETLRLDPDNAAATAGLPLVFPHLSKTDQNAVVQEDVAVMHFGIGKALAEKGQYEDAVKEFQEAIRLDPDFHRAQEDLRGVRTHLSNVLQPPSAAATLPGAAEPAEDALAHFNAGVAFYRQRRFDEAITEYKKVLRLRPNNFEALSNLGKCPGRFRTTCGSDLHVP